MTHPRCLFGTIAFGLFSLSIAAPFHGVASVLPEIKKHLAAGHKYVESGSWEFATANADVVLISDTVSVYVNVDHVAQSQRPTCLKALSAALSQWETSLDETVHFQLEVDPAKANLKVTFRPDVRLDREAVAGLTNWSRSIRASGSRVTEASFKADMQIRARDLNQQPLSFEAIRQETEHEFGHVLGLDDSDHLGDLMGRFDVEHIVNGPRDYEVLAVKSLRDEAKRIKADAQRK
jgi:predicted Zn-dependent protease